MKNLYFTILAFLFLTISNAQIVNIPDANFKARLLQASSNNQIASTTEPNDNGYVSTYNKIDTNNDGEIQVSEALLIKYLRVPGVNINDVTGINAFENLKFFNCANNQISDLDVSGLSKLRILHCHINQLNSLNIKNNNPNSWLTIDFFSNDNMTYICTDEDDIAYIKARALAYVGNFCNVNSYCNFTPGGTFYTIQGTNKFDSNTNGCDATDVAYSNLKFNITDGAISGSLISNPSGNYSIPVQVGTHTITPQLENSLYFIASPSSVTVTFPVTASPSIQDFCIIPNGIYHDLEVVVIPIDVARPGFDVTYKIKYKNKGNQIENATINFNYNDAILDYVFSTVAPTSQVNGNLSWAVGTVIPFQSGEILVKLNLNSPMETPSVNGGEILSYSATANSLTTDETPEDNTFTLSQVVVNSFDPNDKTCLEGTTINPSKIGKYVHYKIRFENTGTFAATNIVVKDIIDTSKFDVSTLQITDASHSCVTRITNPNKVEFIFEDINLPFDDATNDGYVVFKVKTNPTLVVGNTINNLANIYFDYNFPIVTNTATSTFQVLGNNEFDLNNTLALYPIPAKDNLNFSLKNSEITSSISIYNLLGQLIQTVTNPTNSIDVSSLQSGSYLIKVTTDKGIVSGKFVKE